MKYIIRYNFCSKKLSRTVEEIRDDDCPWETPLRRLPGVCHVCDAVACLLSYTPRDPSEGPTLTAPSGHASRPGAGGQGGQEGGHSVSAHVLRIGGSGDRKSKRERISRTVPDTKAISLFL